MSPTPLESHRRHGSGEGFPSAEDTTSPLPDGRQVIGVDGQWYDIKNFLPYHPGGPVLEKFIGQDASQVFHAFGHNPKVLKRCKVVGTYKMRPRHPADEDFAGLIDVFKKRGYFKSDPIYYAKKFAVVFVVWMMVFCCLGYFQQTYMHYLGGVLLALVYQQAGFLMHDFMHTNVFRNRRADRLGGLIFGTFFLGVSSHWWQDEHRVHHALTNVVDLATDFADPQMFEDVWAQNEKLFPLFKGRLKYCLIKIQHLTFVPASMLFGRVAIILDSLKWERRWYEWLAVTLHWTWTLYLFSWLPSWKEALQVYFLAAFLQGILHFQLVLSHYCKECSYLDEEHNSSWCLGMIVRNLNISTPWWQDWFYGGLNFHIEHHLFPMMARQHLRAASTSVQKVCRKHNIKYDSAPFFTALGMTLKTLKTVGHHYKLDPR